MADTPTVDPELKGTRLHTQFHNLADMVALGHLHPSMVMGQLLRIFSPLVDEEIRQRFGTSEIARQPLEMQRRSLDRFTRTLLVRAPGDDAVILRNQYHWDRWKHEETLGTFVERQRPRWNDLRARGWPAIELDYIIRMQFRPEEERFFNHRRDLWTSPADMILATWNEVNGGRRLNIRKYTEQKAKPTNNYYPVFCSAGSRFVSTVTVHGHRVISVAGK